MVVREPQRDPKPGRQSRLEHVHAPAGDPLDGKTRERLPLEAPFELLFLLIAESDEERAARPIRHLDRSLLAQVLDEPGEE